MTRRPVRVQMTGRGAWRAEHPNAIVVARPSAWGNPFPVKVFGRETANALYAQALSGNWSPSLLDQSKPDDYWDLAYKITIDFRRRHGGGIVAETARALLGGSDLACWCGPDDACHADILIAVANPRS